MGAREQRVSQAAKRHPRQAPQKVRGRAKSEFQGEEDQRTKAETVVQRPKEQSRARKILRGVYPERRGEERCFALLSMTAKGSE